MSALGETKNQDVIKVSVDTESVVDSGWIEFVTGGPEGFCDVFFHNGYCGYWLMGVEHDAKLGWLAFEHAAEDRKPQDDERELVIEAWKAGMDLPKHWHRLDLEAAKKSWVAGYRKDGSEWYENGDGVTYDCAIQRALLGGVVYG